MSNTFGSIFRLTTFGESHGVSIGGVIDGFPAGFKINLDAVQRKLNLRRPGFSILTSERKEADVVEFLSGLISDTSSGAPISFIIKNKSSFESNNWAFPSIPILLTILGCPALLSSLAVIRKGSIPLSL